MTHPYEAFRVHEKQLQSSIPTGPASTTFGSTFRSSACAFERTLYDVCYPGRLGASQTCHRRSLL